MKKLTPQEKKELEFIFNSFFEFIIAIAGIAFIIYLFTFINNL